MATIVTRAGKGSPLTNQELDNNFSSLNTDKAELSGATFTGEIVAPSLDISGNIDVDGVTNLDVVDIDGAVDMASTLAVAGVVTVSDGSTSAPSITNAGDANTGIYFPADDNFGIVVGGSRKLLVNSSGVSINNGVLDADGGITVDNFTLDGTSLTLSTGNMELFTSGSNHDILFKGNDGGSFITALRLDMSDFGGAIFNSHVTVPTDLYVGQSIIHNGDSNTYLSFANNDDFRIVVANSTRAAFNTSKIHFNQEGIDQDFRVESNGNANMLFVDGGNDRVGVGTGSPSAPFHSSNTSSGITARFSNDINQTLDIGTVSGSGANGSVYIDNANSGNIQLRTGNAERFNILSGGNITIKTVDAYLYSPASSGGTTIDAGLKFESSNQRLEFWTADAERMSIASNGAATFNGDVTLAASKSLTITSGQLELGANYRVRWGGSNNYSIMSDNNNYVQINADGEDGLRVSNTESTFNESGIDRDFRVESDSQSHMLFVDASAHKVGINQSNPAAMLDIVTVSTAGSDAIRLRQPVSSETYQIQMGVSGVTNEGLVLRNTASTGMLQQWRANEVVINDDGVDRDFRVESDNLASALLVDGGTGNVTMQGATTTIGSGLANTNVEFRLSGVDGKASRIKFSDGVTDRWLLGQGAASETTAFELYNSTGTIALSVNRSTNAATFASDVIITGTSVIAHGGDTDTYLQFDGDDKFRVVTNGAERFAVINEGVVVNEDSHDQDFRVESNANGYALFVDGGTDTVSIGTAATDAKFRVDASNADLRIGYASGYNYFDADVANVYRVGTSSVEAMKMDTFEIVLNEEGADRDFRVESDAITHALFVDGGANSVNFGTASTNPTSGIRFTALSDETKIEINHASGTGSGVAYATFKYNQSTVGSITQHGTSATLYNTSSDQRLKENIADAPSSSDDIDAIQVRSFDWKADGEHQKYGMIAQELLEIAPEAVSVPEDSEEMMGVDYSKLVPMLIKEIQSLRQRVAQLEE